MTNIMESITLRQLEQISHREHKSIEIIRRVPDKLIVIKLRSVR